MINFLIIIIILLDGLITNYLPYIYHHLSYFYPLLTITMLPIIYPYLKKKYFSYYIIMIGIFYDLLYSNILLLNTFIFIIIGLVIKKYYQYLADNYLLTGLLIILNIVIYDLFLFMITYILGNHVISFNDLIYKISHSLLLNIIFGITIYYLLKKLVKKKIIKIYVK